MPDKYDAVIIGGGCNGLTAAAYLAKAGRKVVILETKKMVGGMAVTEEFFSGCKASSLVDGSNSFSPRVSADLNLSRFGLEILPTDPLIFAPQKDGKHLTLWHDIGRTTIEIAKFSKADANAYPAFIKQMQKIAQIVAALNRTELPDMPDTGLRDIAGMLKLVKPVRALGWKNITHMMRILPLSVSDLLDEWFESDVVKAAIGASAINNISLGPQESGTAFTFLQNFANSNNGLFRASGLVKGGLGALTQALKLAAESFGARIFTETEVSQITLQGGRVAGVVLAEGKTISAKAVVSALDMRSTFLHLVDPDKLDETISKRVKNITYSGTMARVHFALDSLPNFTGLSGDARQWLSGHIQMAPALTDIQKAYDPVKYGTFSGEPYLDVQLPNLIDPSLAPEGGHLMSATVKYIPYHLRDGDWNKLRDSLGRLVVKTIAGYAPGFEQCVKEIHVITPLDMEANYHLPEGSLTHGDITLDQSLWMRPIPGCTKYRSPLDGLYLCGAAAHPGAGVTGINGANAARRILKDKVLIN